MHLLSFVHHCSNNKVVFTNHLLYRLFLSLSLLTSPAPACKITFNTSIRLPTSPFLPLHIRLIYGPFISIVPPSCTSVTLAPIDSDKMYVLLSVIDPRAKCKITCLEFSTKRRQHRHHETTTAIIISTVPWVSIYYILHFNLLHPTDSYVLCTENIHTSVQLLSLAVSRLEVDNLHISK